MKTPQEQMAELADYNIKKNQMLKLSHDEKLAAAYRMKQEGKTDAYIGRIFNRSATIARQWRLKHLESIDREANSIKRGGLMSYLSEHLPRDKFHDVFELVDDLILQSRKEGMDKAKAETLKLIRDYAKK